MIRNQEERRPCLDPDSCTLYAERQKHHPQSSTLTTVKSCPKKRATSITADTDLRLCRFFGLSEGYFLRLQNAYDTLEAKRRIMPQVAKIKPYRAVEAA